MVQLDIGRRPVHRADQCDAVVIFVEAHEHHAAGHHVVGIDIGNLEPQNLDVETHRALDIGAIEHDMPKFHDIERDVFRPSASTDRGRIDSHASGAPSKAALHCIPRRVLMSREEKAGLWRHGSGSSWIRKRVTTTVPPPDAALNGAVDAFAAPLPDWFRCSPACRVDHRAVRTHTDRYRSGGQSYSFKSREAVPRRIKSRSIAFRPSTSRSCTGRRYPMSRQ